MRQQATKDTVRKGSSQALDFLSEVDLRPVQEKILSCFASDAPRLTEISEYLYRLGGKRVRPVLAILCEKLFRIPQPSQQLVEAAAGIELIHMATLLHDDIIDQSPTRRHQQSAYLRFGAPSTLLAGDFLLVKAFGLCAQLDPFIISATEDACIALTEGEELEGHLIPGREVTLDSYEDVIDKKTASLFSLSAAVGAFCSGTSSENVELLRNFGQSAGLLFQMVDDILDVTADEDLLGKPTGTDLRQKTPSLVNVLWLESGDRKAKEFFEQEEITDEEAKRAAHYLKNSGIIAECFRLAEKKARAAEECLSKLPGSEIDNNIHLHLSALLQFTLERSK